MKNLAHQVVETAGTNAIAGTVLVSNGHNLVSLSRVFEVSGLTIMAVAAFLAVRHWLKKAVATFEKDAQGKLLEDILDALVPNEANRTSLHEELSAMISSGTQSPNPVLSSILRIEESFEKRHGNKYLRRVSILRRKDDSSVSLVKIESEISWEYLPKAVRGEFIRARGDKVVRRIFDAEKERN